MGTLATTNPVSLERIECLTCFGNASDTAQALLEGKRGLELLPVLGEDGGEPVPLALISPMKLGVPPRWLKPLLALAEPVSGNQWGTARRPVLVTGSNFGIEAMYGYHMRREAAFIPWGTSHDCVARLHEQLGWGPNVTVFSHACVTAQLGLLQAARLLEDDAVDAVLVFSFDFLSPFVSGGFHALKILNSGMPQPYADADAGSIGLGDGAAWATVRRGEGACTIRAQNVFNELHHFTANEPGGSGFRALLEPFESLAAERDIWIKGHGTGTLEAGRLESTACHQFFPEAPLVSWKGSLGHTLGSCALVEFAVAEAAHKTGRIPGTVGTSGSTFCKNVASAPIDAARYASTLHLSNAFGGAHAAMLVDHA